MAAKTATVAAHAEPDRKIRANEISVETGFTVPKAYNELTKEEFDAALAVGLAQARAGLSAPADEVFGRLLGELANG